MLRNSGALGYPKLSYLKGTTNLDPALAQADQCSAVLESNTLQNQDLDHGPGVALCNNVFSGCDNTDGVGISSSMDIDISSAIVSHKFIYAFPGCDNNDKDGDDNNRGGFSSRTNSARLLQNLLHDAEGEE